MKKSCVVCRVGALVRLRNKSRQRRLEKNKKKSSTLQFVVVANPFFTQVRALHSPVPCRGVSDDDDSSSISV